MVIATALSILGAIIFGTIILFGIFSVIYLKIKDRRNKELREDVIDNFLLKEQEIERLRDEMVLEKFYMHPNMCERNEFEQEFDWKNKQLNITFHSEQERNAALKKSKDEAADLYIQELEESKDDAPYVDFIIGKIGYDGLRMLMKLREKWHFIGIRGMEE